MRESDGGLCIRGLRDWVWPLVVSKGQKPALGPLLDLDGGFGCELLVTQGRWGQVPDDKVLEWGIHDGGGGYGSANFHKCVHKVWEPWRNSGAFGQERKPDSGVQTPLDGVQPGGGLWWEGCGMGAGYRRRKVLVYHMRVWVWHMRVWAWHKMVWV